MDHTHFSVDCKCWTCENWNSVGRTPATQNHSGRRIWVREDVVDGINIAWIEVPKNASTSLKRVFGDKRPLKIREADFHRVTSRNKVFAVRRNPYRRFISLYNYYTTGNKSGPKFQKALQRAEIESKTPTVEEFCRVIYHLDTKTRCHHVWPQTCFLPRRLSNIVFVDIGQVEESIERNLGIRLKVPMKNKQKAKKGKKPLLERLTEDQMDLVYTIYQQDFVKLGYDRDDAGL